MRRRSLAAAAALAVLLVAPAAAQDANTTDPSGDSPAGVLYVIPGESGRADAAPRQTGAPATAPAVPVAPAPVAPATSAPAPAPVITGSAAQPRSPLRTENHFGSSSRVPGVAAAALEELDLAPQVDAADDQTPAALATTGGPSPGGTILILVLAALIPAAFVLGRRRS